MQVSWWRTSRISCRGEGVDRLADELGPGHVLLGGEIVECFQFVVGEADSDDLCGS